MRPISFQRSYTIHPAGSVLACCGDTKVLCTATVEDSVPPWLRGTGKGWVTAEYAMLPGSTGGGRKRRDGAKPDGRSVEIQRLIGRSLRAGVNLETLGEVSIIVDCDVIQADGGTRTTAISGGWVALVDALAVVAQARGEGDGRQWLLGQISAISVGMVDGAVVVDLDYAHDSRAEVDMNVVARDDAYVEIQGTGEQGVFSRSQLDALLDGAASGLATVQAAQRQALGW
ncbi:MAG: ribonuclease PH [Planctomycetota bacterium]|nr:MAG: ribonuclease PH [Planctomycetota bacterium]